MTTPMVEGYGVRIFTSARLGERKNLEAVFAALAAHGLEPTHAGEREHSVEPFEGVDAVAALLQRKRVLSFARRKAPRYAGDLGAPDAGLTSISIDIGTTPNPQRIYELGDQLAELLHPPYAVVQPLISDGTRFSAAGRIELDWLQRNGPLGVAARTWYGTHIVALIGEDRIRAAGEVTPLRWGGLRLDLVHEPWTADVATLKQRQADAIAAIAPAQVLGDYSHPVKYKPGARWAAIPERAA